MILPVYLYGSDQVIKNFDSFAAQGGIYTILTLDTKNQSQQIEKQDPYTTIDEYNYSKEENIQERIKNITLKENNYILRGMWNIKVISGHLQDFSMFFGKYDYQKNLINTYALYNLQNSDYIYINQTGGAAMQGSVDFKSIGQVNENLSKIPIKLLISQFKLFKLEIDDEIERIHFANQPITGLIGVLVDEDGTIIIGKKETNN